MSYKIGIWDPCNFGDHMLCTPVYRHLKTDAGVEVLDVLFDPKPHGHRASINFLETNPYVDNLIITNQWDMGPVLANQYDYSVILRSHYGNWKKFPGMHIKDILCGNIERDFNTEIKDRKIDIFLTDEDLEFGSIYSGCVSFMPFADFMKWAREWNPISKWLELGDKFVEKGLEVVVLGASYSSVFDKFTNLSGKTTARKAISVIKSSSLHICVSTFSEIVTDFYKIPTLVLSGSTDPSIVGYSSNNSMTRRIDCWPCFSGRLKPAICGQKNIPCMDFGVVEVYNKCMKITDLV